MKKNAIVGQSGGPTAVINASLYGVVYEALNREDVIGTIYGMINGIEGFLNENMMDMKPLEVNGELELIKTTPGSYLGSCRYKLPEDLTDAVYPQLFEKFEKYNIGYFFYIGGNDSMDTVSKLSRYAETVNSEIRFIGIPKTIDNDLCLTDHTPGFGSAAKYIASTILEIAHDTFSYPVPSVTIVEIMGRDAGWLTSASALARNEYNTAPHLIYLPEAPFDTAQFLADVKELLKKQNTVIIAVSEGIRDKNGNYISAASQTTDGFGHSHLSGAGKALENFVTSNIDIKVRSIEINVLQRSGAHISSATDLTESFELGHHAVELAEEGVTGCMFTLKRLSSNPYKVAYGHENVAKIANEIRSVPREWINEAGNDVLPPMYEYLRPLIIGEPDIRYKNGLPDYMDISHLTKA